MIIVITGKTASGKDSIVKSLIKNHHAKRIVTYTTRPMRKNEINGVDYHFINDDKFKELVEQGFFAEYKSYVVDNGDTWYYGSAKEDYVDDENKIVILTPNGLKDVKNLIGLGEINNRVISFYIDVDDKIIKERLLQRGDDSNEAKRRLKSDKSDFEDICNKVDYVIRNNGILTINGVTELIMSVIRYEEKKGVIK